MIRGICEDDIRLEILGDPELASSALILSKPRRAENAPLAVSHFGGLSPTLPLQASVLIKDKIRVEPNLAPKLVKPLVTRPVAMLKPMLSRPRPVATVVKPISGHPPAARECSYAMPRVQPYL